MLHSDDIERIKGPHGDTLTFSDPMMHSTVLYESEVVQFTTEMLSVRRSDFTELKDMSIGQFTCLLFNDEEREKDSIQSSKLFEGVKTLSSMEQLKNSDDSLKDLSNTDFAQ